MPNSDKQDNYREHDRYLIANGNYGSNQDRANQVTFDGGLNSQNINTSQNNTEFANHNQNQKKPVCKWIY